MTECNKTFPQSHEALLSSADGFTAFRFGGYNIRFRAPYSLERYVDVIKWDDGYLVVTWMRSCVMNSWMIWTSTTIR